MNIRKVFSVAVAVFAAACSNDGTGPRAIATNDVGLTFGVMNSLTTSAALGTNDSLVRRTPTSAMVSGDTLIILGTRDTMRITQVQLTIEEVELERDGQTATCSGDATGASASLRFRRGADDGAAHDVGDDHGVDDDDADCEDHIGGPVLVDLHLDGSGTSQITVPAVLGVYDTLQFDFDVADEDNAASASYRAAHPEMANASVRIVGTFNGSPFELKLDSRLKYEVALSMPLTVSDGTTGFELNVAIDLGAWLTRPDGSIINPAAICSLGTRCIDRETIEANMDNARVRADGRRRGRD